MEQLKAVDAFTATTPVAASKQRTGTVRAGGKSASFDPRLSFAAATLCLAQSLIPPSGSSYHVSADGFHGAVATNYLGSMASAQSKESSIPQSLGWYAIPTSKLESVCPSDPAVQAAGGCRGVIEAWSGGIADAKRSRMIIWGGGHADYYGNEIYALDLNSLTMKRLNDPSPVDNVSSCPEAYSDRTPSSRHTYGGLAYVAHADRMFVFGGSKANCGFFSTGTWTLDLGALKWRQMNPSGTKPQGGPGQVSDYEPDSKLVFLHDYVSGLYAYNYDTNNWKQVLSDPYGIDYHMSGAIDPKRKLFVIAGASGSQGGGIVAFKIGGSSSSKITPKADSTCNNVLTSQSAGFAYDSALDKIVVWPNVGNTVYLLDDTTWACKAVTYPDGPADSSPPGTPPRTNGTFGRFRYFPDKRVFAVVNGSNVNAYILRLTATKSTLR